MTFRYLILIGFVLLMTACSTQQAIVHTEPTEHRIQPVRYLILTADDYGVSQNVNEGIDFAADEGILTAIEVMTNFTASLPRLKALQAKHPEIGIGIHLNITSGKPILDSSQVPSLVDEAGNFHELTALLPLAKRIDLGELKMELHAQVKAAQDAGIIFDHFSNQHNILALYSPFFDVVVELAELYDVALRSTIVGSIENPELYPEPYSKKQGKETAMAFIKAAPAKAVMFLKYGKIEEMMINQDKINAGNIPSPDRVIDYFYGNPTAENLIYILNTLPEGINEIAFHLGTSTRETDYPSGLNQNYFANREFELATLTSQYIKDILHKSEIKVIGYKDLERLKKSLPY